MNCGSIATSETVMNLASHHLWLICLLVIVLVRFAAAEEREALPRKRFAIVIHGGAGTDPAKMPKEEAAAMEASLQKVLAMGLEMLDKDGTSLDTVEKVIRFLEDDPVFNAGKGAVFN